MPHADSSLVPPEITSKAEFWFHVRDQLQHLLEGQRHWVTNLANSSSLIYNALLAFKPHFGNDDRAVNWCGEPHFRPLALLRSLAAIVSRSHLTQPVFPSRMHDAHKSSLDRRAPHSDSVIAGFYLISSLFPKPRFVGVPLRDQNTATTNENTLFLGPFCGKPACQYINVSPHHARGVCAGAFLQQKPMIVPNTDEYPGHIACDGETKSEIVCPMILQNGNDQVVLGVLDLDCLALGGFDEQDKIGLEAIADLIVKGCDW